MSLRSGTSFLHYRLLERIGEGGMGEVWRAADTSLSSESLNHPNVATIHGFHRCTCSWGGKDPDRGSRLERETGFEPATLSLGS